MRGFHLTRYKSCFISRGSVGQQMGFFAWGYDLRWVPFGYSARLISFSTPCDQGFFKRTLRNQSRSHFEIDQERTRGYFPLTWAAGFGFAQA